MCIIAYGLKKDLRRAEVSECMRTNGAGFFITAIKPDKTISEPLRTMDRQKVFEYYDGAGDEDHILLHARIPSCGSKTIDNVHGWEEDGIRFCHNGTMSALAKWEDHTDSETFFRRIFMPCWRGEGRKFTDNVEYVIKHFAGSYNKFAFLLPDGEVKLYGKFVEDHGCKFSNQTYKPPKPVSYTPPARRYDNYSDYWQDELPAGSVWSASSRIKLDGSTLMDLAGKDLFAILDFSVRHYLACCQACGRQAPPWVPARASRQDNMWDYAENTMFLNFARGPGSMVDEVYELLKELKFPEAYDEDKKGVMTEFLTDYCELAENWAITPTSATDVSKINTALETIEADIDAALDLMRITDLGVPVKHDLSERFVVPRVVVTNEGTAGAKAIMTRTKATDLFRFTEHVSDEDTEKIILPSFVRISNVAARTRLASVSGKKGK